MFVSFVMWSLCVLLLICLGVVGSFARRNPFLWTLLVTSVKVWVRAKWTAFGQLFCPVCPHAPLTSDSESDSGSGPQSEEGIEDPGDLCVMDIQHHPQFTLITYAYRHLQYKHVLGMDRINQISQDLEVEFEMLGTDSLRKLLVPVLRVQKQTSDIVLKIVTEMQEELPGELCEKITQLFGPFAGMPDPEGFCAYLQTLDPNCAHPFFTVSCLDHRYLVDQTQGIVTRERLTTEEEA